MLCLSLIRSFWSTWNNRKNAKMCMLWNRFLTWFIAESLKPILHNLQFNNKSKLISWAWGDCFWVCVWIPPCREHVLERWRSLQSVGNMNNYRCVWRLIGIIQTVQMDKSVSAITERLQIIFSGSVFSILQTMSAYSLPQRICLIGESPGCEGLNSCQFNH